MNKILKTLFHIQYLQLVYLERNLIFQSYFHFDFRYPPLQNKQPPQKQMFHHSHLKREYDDNCFFKFKSIVVFRFSFTLLRSIFFYFFIFFYSIFLFYFYNPFFKAYILWIFMDFPLEYFSFFVYCKISEIC